MRELQTIISPFWDSVLIIVFFAALYLFFEIVTKKENEMPKFRKRVKIVEANRWFPGKQVEGVIEVTGEKSGDFGHCVTTQQVLTKVCPGDWVITESDGKHHYPCDDKEFRASYDPVDDDAVKALNEEPKDQQ